jgi:hypothetical protein
MKDIYFYIHGLLLEYPINFQGYNELSPKDKEAILLILDLRLVPLIKRVREHEFLNPLIA